MGSAENKRDLRGALLFSVIIAVIILEIFGHIIERGIGHYLKWENHNRPQLGRLWERDRENIVAQKKINSILSSLDLREQSAGSLKSFKALFENIAPSSPLPSRYISHRHSNRLSPKYACPIRAIRFSSLTAPAVSLRNRFNALSLSTNCRIHGRRAQYSIG